MDIDTFKPINIRGAELRYRRKGHGEPFVLVHANIGDVRNLAAMEEKLAKHFEVINYCRRYHWPNKQILDGEDDPWEEQAEDLAALIGKLQLGPVHLYGNSSGAILCLLVARTRPDLVRSLFLAEPIGMTIFMPRLPPGIFDLLNLLWRWPFALIPLVTFGATTAGPCATAFGKGDLEGGLRTFRRGLFNEKQNAALTTERVQQMRDNIKPHASAFIGSGLPKMTETEMGNIKVPTLFLTGENTCTPHRVMDYYMTRMIPGAKEVQIKWAGHLVHEDNPDDVVREILKLLNRI